MQACVTNSYLHLQSFDLIFACDVFLSFTVTNFQILCVIAAWNYVISHEYRSAVFAGGGPDG
jgi:hypothetical protein